MARLRANLGLATAYCGDLGLGRVLVAEARRIAESQPGRSAVEKAGCRVAREKHFFSPESNEYLDEFVRQLLTEF